MWAVLYVFVEAGPRVFFFLYLFILFLYKGYFGVSRGWLFTEFLYIFSVLITFKFAHGVCVFVGKRDARTQLLNRYVAMQRDIDTGICVLEV